MPYYNKEQIARAREMDLLTYLQAYEPQELVHVAGNTWCTREHDSLKISNGKWMWWSQGFGGASALDYLVKVQGDSFTKAVAKILGREAKAPPFSFAKGGSGAGKSRCIDNDFAANASASAQDREQPEEKMSTKLLLPPRSSTTNEVMKYLTARGIVPEIIRDCIREGLIYESLPYHNCMFVGFDEANTPRYASYRACNPQRIMGEAAGSDKRYAFHVTGTDDGNTLHVFESAIDLLSFATIIQGRTGNWRSESMLSLGGIYVSGTGRRWKTPVALEHQLKKNSDIDTIALHLDGDNAGRAAAARLIVQLGCDYRIRDEPPIHGKDVNDELQYQIRKRFRATREREEYAR